MIYIKHGDYETRYDNLVTTCVSQNTSVESGQLIGYGYGGYHHVYSGGDYKYLCFEFLKNNKKLNPVDYFRTEYVQR